MDTDQLKSDHAIRKNPVLIRALRFVRRNFFWVCIIIALLLLALAFELGRYSVYAANPSLQGQQQAAEILHEVGQLIQLPSGETPTMASINNAAVAKQNQPFLANAENGDVLIVYTNVGEALLYRPSTDKLIAVGPVESPNTAQSQAETPIPQVAATTTDATDTPSNK